MHHDQSKDTIYAITCHYGLPQCGFDYIVAKTEADLNDMADDIAEDCAYRLLENDPDMTSDEALELAWSYFGPMQETTAGDVARSDCNSIIYMFSYDGQVHCTNESVEFDGCDSFAWDYLAFVDEEE